LTSSLQTKSPPLQGRAARNYLEKRLGFSFEGLEPFPKYYLIETVNVCNSDCVMCAYDFKKRPRQVMDDRLFEKIAAEISRHSHLVEKVALYWGGEPLLDPKLAERVKRMKAAGVKRVNIATNASLLFAGQAAELIKAGLDEIYISFDSLDKATYEAIRQGLKFERVYQNILDLIKTRDELGADLAIRLQMIAQEKNLAEVEHFREHWLNLLAPRDQIVVQKAHNWANTIEVINLDQEDVNAYPCLSPFGTCVVDVQGRVCLCCADIESKYVLGDLTCQSLAEVWCGQPYERVRQLHLNGRRRAIPLCDGCTVWRDEKHIG